MRADDLQMEQAREFLKDRIRQQFDFATTAQNRGEPPPPIQKPYPPASRRILLPRPGAWTGVGHVDIETAIRNRQSLRQYTPDALRPDELSFLLWATQGIRKRLNAGTALRTVPSAGARHALETYLCVLRITDLPAGIYRYLPLEHELVHVAEVKDLANRLADATLGQSFAGKAAVTFVWSAIPRRMEWRYGLASHKVIALDAGHVCQNLYLACQAVGAGTCAIAAYDQDAMDELIGVDGREEFVVYVAPVGKV
jgi:SagB-type dehydrogenase family enzyme